MSYLKLSAFTAIFLCAASASMAADLRCAAGTPVKYQDNALGESTNAFLCVARPNRNSVCAAGYSAAGTSTGYTCRLSRPATQACRVDGRGSRARSLFHTSTETLNVNRLERGETRTFLQSVGSRRGGFIAYECWI
jgi:hypothetical protein